MYLLNPVYAVLHSTQTNRWHPILFVESPLPGPPSPEKPVRHKSAGHHTEGFASRQEALANIDSTIEECLKGGHASHFHKALAEDIAWEDSDIPATVAFFDCKPDGTAARVL